MAGLVVSESEFDSQVMAEIIPFRDLFSTLFFVAVGMLVDPGFLIANVGLVVGLIAALVLGKLLIIGGALLAAGVDHRTATLVATLMAQMGEFSFVLSGVGLTAGLIDLDQYGLILAVALGSILLVPLGLAAAPMLVTAAEYLPGVEAQERHQAGPEPEEPPLSGHVVVCGYGRVGTELGEALRRRGFAYTVVELNPAIVRDLRQRGIPAVYGDAAAEAVLMRAGIQRARILAVATPDLVAARAAIHQARRLNPRIRVIARATTGGGVSALGEAGAGEVVQPEFEAGLEFVRQVLRWHGVSAREVDLLLAGRRAHFYQAGSQQPGSAASEQ
jgi:CPA2 family monovalent cation:H+ antiporter-2